MANKRTIKARYARLLQIVERLEQRSKLTQSQKDVVRQLKDVLRSVDPQGLSSQDNFSPNSQLDHAEGLIMQRFPDEGLGLDEQPDAEQRQSADADNEASDALKDAKSRVRQAADNKRLKQPTGSSAGKPSVGSPARTAGSTASRAAAAAGERAAIRAAAGAQAKAAAGTAVRGVVLRNPWVLGALLVLVLIVAIIGAVMAAGPNGVFSGVGGSVPQRLDYKQEADKALVAKVQAFVQPENGEPVIEVVAPADPKDLWEWKEVDGLTEHAMDRRILSTLSYLVDRGWDKIVIGLLKTNGPDKTRRQKTDGVRPVDIDAYSAYSSGQAMGIVAIGKTSPGLTACLKLDSAVPVQVAWQETLSDDLMRPIHEQLQADLTGLAVNLKRDLATAAVRTASRDELGQQVQTPVGRESARYLDLVRQGLVNAEGVFQSGGSAPARRYVADALSALAAVNMADVAESEPSLRRAINAAFRMMQVANMVGWEGSRENGCRLWKAYEARQNIRKLELHILQMPIVRGEDEIKFDTSKEVKQMIVFSPEDDLNNGLPDTDMFPSGPLSVDVGGMSYDTRGADGRITPDGSDNFYMSLPMDNGILAKRSTVFVTDGQENAVAGQTQAEQDGGEAEMDELWDGAKESLARQSYKKFVHIGF